MGTINVTVRLLGGNLDVVDGGVGIPVPRGQGLQYITWELDPVTLPNARFEPVGEAGIQDGWTMLSTHRKGVFSGGNVAPGHRHLSVVVDNPSEATKGDYSYMLRARSGNKVYTTLQKSSRRTVTNPIIINK